MVRILVKTDNAGMAAVVVGGHFPILQIVCSAFLMSLGCFAILFGLYGIIYTDWSIRGIIALLGGIAVIIASMALVFIHHGK